MPGSSRAAWLTVAFACTAGGVAHSQAVRVPTLVPAVPHAQTSGGSSTPLHQLSNSTNVELKLPVAFEENKGQLEEHLAFGVRTIGGTLGIGRDGAVIVSAAETAPARTDGVTTFHLVGGRRVQAIGTDPVPGRVRYMRGNDPRLWIPEVSLYRKVRLRDVYEGIDWEWSVKQESIEYDFIVRPGAEPRRIAIAFGRSVRLRVVDGTLNVVGDEGVTEHRRPRAYQDIDGDRREIPASWRIAGSQAGIAVGPYDRRFPLIIDPVISWTAYVGGPAGEEGSDVAVGTDGAVYVAGSTTDTQDAFIAKFTSAGGLVYLTYFGGSTTDFAPKLAVAGDFVYFAGGTHSSDFPMVAAVQPALGGGRDGYAGALRSDGSFAFSTFLGGTSIDHLQAVATAADGTAWMSGVTFSADWPTVSPFQSALGGQTDTVLVHWSGSGQLLMSSYFGDGACEGAGALAVAPDGAIYMGGTYSTAVRTPFPPFVGCSSVQQGRLAKFSPGGTSSAWSQVLAGTDGVSALAVQANGKLWVTGTTTKSTMPTTADAYDGTCGTDGSCGGGADGFLSVRDSSGSQTYGTYLGGSGWDDGGAVAVDDSAGTVWVVGTTASTEWPTTGSIGQDAFVLRFGGPSPVVNYATRFGGTENDRAWGVATGTQVAYVVGTTRSTSLPGQRNSLTGPSDAFIAHIASLANVLFIDAPSDQSRVRADFVVEGWAIDDSGPTGAGINAIHMWAFPLDAPGRAPHFLGVAAYGLPRGDVGEAFGARFTPSGYRLAVSLPGFGRYLIGVYGRSSITSQFSAVRTVTVNAADLARITIDAPSSGAHVTGPLTVSGWALDQQATRNSGVDGVDVWAFPDGAADAIFVGAAFYGQERPDVAAQFGAQFRFSGFHVVTSHLWAGRYTLVAYPHYAGTSRYGAPAAVPMQVDPGAMVWLDSPVGSTTISQPFTISGWALDRRTFSGPGVDQVLVYANKLSEGSAGNGSFEFMGVAESGMPRPDVAMALGAQFVNCGYRLTVAGLQPGSYRIGVYARSTNPSPGTFPYFETWTGIIQVE